MYNIDGKEHGDTRFGVFVSLRPSFGITKRLGRGDEEGSGAGIRRQVVA